MKTRNFTAARPAFGLSLAAISTILLASHGMAQNVMLQSGSSTANVNVGGGTGPIGMNNWTVGGQNQLDQQWFWFSDGSGVQSIDQLGASGPPNVSSDGSTLTETYQNSSLAIQIQYSLSGSGSGADLSVSAYVFNLTSQNLNVNFYQYGNFALQGQANSLNVYGNTQNGYSTVVQQTTGGSSGIQETINQPYANYAAADSPGNVMADMYANTPLNGPYSASGSVAWAFEWSSVVAPFAGNPANAWNALQDQSMNIAQVPEPAGLALLGMGMGIFGLVRRAWKRSA